MKESVGAVVQALVSTTENDISNTSISATENICVKESVGAVVQALKSTTENDISNTSISATGNIA